MKQKPTKGGLLWAAKQLEKMAEEETDVWLKERFKTAAKLARQRAEKATR